MAKKNINIDEMNVDEEDFEYEKKLAEEERLKKQQAEEKAAAEEAAREKRKREAEKERTRQIEEERRELLKMKSGLTSEEDSEFTKKDEAYEKPHGKAAVANFWYHYKFIVIFSFITLVVLGYLIYSESTRKRDDISVMVITDNDLTLRTEEIEEFFEKYTDDIDGNGYVHVGVIVINISRQMDTVTKSTYSQKFLAEIQTGEGMIVITDSHTSDEFMSVMKTDLDKDFPDNKYIDEDGFSFNSKVMAEEFNYELMPNDVHMSIRIPQDTMGLSKDEAQKYYDESFEIYQRIVEDITARCEETNDPGLTTEPVKYEDEEE
ncbi:hypothetical protein [Ruminococcus albus]|uniref:Uncharacterized protein n=1 Tax=Ruminococcus albus TaxID=1264 RepID=A0A1H7FPI1_RUMAL|nr:hypothetical protein [Ruminococcus albus]SEK27841.1 hypothetical protein SAMN05216469_101352 [Ruminococcus albus]